jgi:hypothetical protein
VELAVHRQQQRDKGHHPFSTQSLQLAAVKVAQVLQRVSKMLGQVVLAVAVDHREQRVLHLHQDKAITAVQVVGMELLDMAAVAVDQVALALLEQRQRRVQVVQEHLVQSMEHRLQEQ